MAQHTTSPWVLRPSTIESSDQYYTRRSKEASEANLAKQAVKPSGLDAYYAEKREAEQLSEQAERERIAASSYALKPDLARLPKTDPLVIKARWEHFHPGEQYPGEK